MLEEMAMSMGPPILRVPIGKPHQEKGGEGKKIHPAGD
jgi:hypothetical protein